MTKHHPDGQPARSTSPSSRNSIDQGSPVDCPAASGHAGSHDERRPSTETVHIDLLPRPHASEEASPKVRSNGQREDFSRSKLETSFHRALHKRHVEAAKVEEAIERIEQAVLNEAKREHSSGKIGEMVMATSAHGYVADAG